MTVLTFATILVDDPVPFFVNAYLISSFWGRGGTTGSKGQLISFSLLTSGMVFSGSLGDF